MLQGSIRLWNCWYYVGRSYIGRCYNDDRTVWFSMEMNNLNNNKKPTKKKIFVCLHYIYKNDSKWTVPLFQSPQIKKIAIIFMQNVCIWFFFTIWMFWVWIKGYMRQPSTSQYDLKQWLKQALYRKL